MINIRKLIYKSYKGFNKSLGFLEKARVSDINKKLPLPVVFIIGAPRCGSTIVYQTLATSFNFSFFSNLHCTWFGAPWFVELFYNAPYKFQSNPKFKSRHGFTEGLYAPSECGEYWYRFFRRNPPHITQEEFSQDSMKALRASFHSFLKAAQKPLLLKNLYSVLRLEPLIKTFPEAVFLVIHRKPIDIAHSILKARYRKSGNYDDWFSLETPGHEKLKTELPEIQVTEQIRTTYQLIKKAEQQFPKSSFHHFNYEDFCQNPEKSLSEIEVFFNKNNIHAEQVAQPPSAFDMRGEVTIDPELYERLSKYLSENPID